MKTCRFVCCFITPGLELPKYNSPQMEESFLCQPCNHSMCFIMSTHDDMAGKGKPHLYNQETETKLCHVCNFSHPCLGG